MRSTTYAFVVLLAVSASTAYEVAIYRGEPDLYEPCSGMWADQNTFINVTFDIAHSTGQLELLVFEVSDYRYIGRHIRGSSSIVRRFCDHWDVEQGDCTEEEQGHYLFNLTDGISLSDTSIWTARLVFPQKERRFAPDYIETLIAQSHATHRFTRQALRRTPSSFISELYPRDQRVDHDSTPVANIDYRDPIQYAVRQDGYYCVWKNPIFPRPTPSPDRWPTYKGTVLFQNTFSGKLPAADYLKLVFYAVAFSLTSLVTFAWGGAYWKHGGSVLSEQNIMSCLIAGVEMDMLLALVHLIFTNVYGQGTASATLHFLTEIVHAGRNTLTLLVMLLICRGHSILQADEAPRPLIKYPTWLFSLHLLSGVLFASGQVLAIEYPERVTQMFELTTAGQLKCSIIVLVPTTMIFLCRILSSWIRALRYLSSRGQHTIRRKYIYTGCFFFLAFAVYFVLRIYTIHSYETRRWHPYMAADEWRLLWLTDGPGGWREFPYFPAFVAIVFLWMPSERNSKIFAYDEIPQNEDAEHAVAPHESGDAVDEGREQTVADDNT